LISFLQQLPATGRVKGVGSTDILEAGLLMSFGMTFFDIPV
jgi:hypothetical protein